MKQCPECNGRLFVRNVANVVNYTEDDESGEWECINCGAKFVVKEKDEGLFYENAQPKRIN